MEKSRRILITTGVYPPEIGGPATYSKLLSDKLPFYNVKVDVLPFSVVRGYPKIIRHFLYFFKTLKLAHSVDIIFAQDTVSVGLPSMLVTKIMGKKFFVRVPGDYAWEQATQRFGVTDSIDDFQNKRHNLRTEILKMIQRLVVNNANVVITPSVYFKNLVSRWCNNPQKVHAIYNGVELNSKSIDKSIARKKLNIDTNIEVLFSAGRLVPWKGFELLIDLVGDFKKEGRYICLYIVGDGPDNEKLRSLIDKKNLQENVFMLGSIGRSKLYEYLFAADVFVLNTGFESFSFQIVEAMNCNLPVVSTIIGNLSEIIDSGEEGLLVKYNSKHELKSAVVRFLTDDVFRNTCVLNAKEKSKMFSIESTISNLLKLF